MRNPTQIKLPPKSKRRVADVAEAIRNPRRVKEAPRLVIPLVAVCYGAYISWAELQSSVFGYAKLRRSAEQMGYPPKRMFGSRLEVLASLEKLSGLKIEQAIFKSGPLIVRSEHGRGYVYRLTKMNQILPVDTCLILWEVVY